MKKLFLVFVCTILLMANCDSPTKDDPNHNPPADHTINKDGAMHKSGLNDPIANCASCHGNDLKGGSVGVSCFECHGKKW